MTAEVDDAAAAGSDALTDRMAFCFIFCLCFMALELKSLCMYDERSVDLRKAASDLKFMETL